MPEYGYNPGDPPGWFGLILGTLIVLILLLLLKSCF